VGSVFSLSEKCFCREIKRVVSGENVIRLKVEYPSQNGKDGRLGLKYCLFGENDFCLGVKVFFDEGTGLGLGKNDCRFTCNDLFLKAFINEIIVHEWWKLQYLFSVEISIFVFFCGVITGLQVFPCYNPFAGRGKKLGSFFSF